MYMYMCVHIYIYIYIYIHTCVYVCVYMSRPIVTFRLEAPRPAHAQQERTHASRNPGLRNSATSLSAGNLPT